MKNKVAILQSNYIPWKGYFDLIASVDTFVIYDEVQYTKQDWRNRNRIKTLNGVKWLSVPVTVNGLYSQRVCDTLVAKTNWGHTHWAKLEASYCKAKYFDLISSWLKPLYLASKDTNLSDLNLRFIKSICEFLEINTEILDSRSVGKPGGKSERLVNICKELGAENYISGPAAKAYLDEQLFITNGVSVSWFDYSGYKEYPQLFSPFDHNVTVLDLLFSVGEEAGEFLRHAK